MEDRCWVCGKEEKEVNATTHCGENPFEIIDLTEYGSGKVKICLVCDQILRTYFKALIKAMTKVTIKSMDDEFNIHKK